MTTKIKKRKIKSRKNVPVDGLPKHKLRYKFKPGFADKVKSHALKVYRETRGKEFELGGVTVLRSLDFVQDYVDHIVVKNTVTGTIANMPVIRLTVLAKLLDTSYQTIWRWTSETAQLPEPILVEVSKGRERPVYHAEEVRAIIRVIGEHLNEFKYYRKDHVGTRDRLVSEVSEVRSTNYGELSNGSRKSTGKGPGKVARKVARKNR